MFVIPTWNQLDDPLPDSRLDPYRENDCGEECCAMTIWAYRGGLSFSAGCIRQAIPGHSSSGLTNGPALQTLLHRFRIESARNVTDHPANDARQALRQGRLCIVLAHFSDTNSTAHWRLVVGQEDSGLIHVNDPWGGIRRTYTDDAFHALYAGEFIELTESVPGWVPTK